MTKEEVLKKIVNAYNDCCTEKNTNEVPLAKVIQMTGFKKDEIYDLFEADSYEKILLDSKLFDVFIPEGKQHQVIRIKKQQDSSIQGRIKALLTYLNQNLYGKEEAVRLALLSAVANESIFFMGPPGTAKSMISRRIAAAFSDFYKDGNFTTENGSYFEYLMNEFSTPDEI